MDGHTVFDYEEKTNIIELEFLMDFTVFNNHMLCKKIARRLNEYESCIGSVVHMFYGILLENNINHIMGSYLQA